MDKEERKKLEADIEKAAYANMSDPGYWVRRRHRWDEWGSPVGLTIAWTLFVLTAGVFIYLLHLSGLIG